MSWIINDEQRRSIVDKTTGISLNSFEDLIDNFTPVDDILSILNVSEKKLDSFCKKYYNMPYRDTYRDLSARAMYYNRKAFNQLAKEGNGKAIDVVAKYIMKMDEGDRNQALRIVVDGVMPKVNKGED